VQDLHQVTPDAFLESSGGSIHALSYQQARNFSTPTGQVYVAEPGYLLSRAGIPKHSVILSVQGKPTPNLEALAKVMSHIPGGTQVPVQYRVFSDRFRKRQTLVYVDRRWYGPPVLWKRDDAVGSWHQIKFYPFEEEEEKETQQQKKKQKLSKGEKDGDSFVLPEENGNGKGNGNGISGGNKGAAEDPKDVIAKSLVLVDVEIPEVALADGVHSKSFTGNGVLVHLDEAIGLILVDRNTAAIGPSDIRLSFCAYPAELRGTVRFLHPLYNFSLISFDPRKLSADALQAVRPCKIVAEPALSRGSKVILVGLSGALRPTARDASVTNATASLNIPAAEIPRFHVVNEEVIELDQDFGTSFSGVLIDEEASVKALWGSFSRQVGGEEREFCAGIHSYSFKGWIEKTVDFLKKGQGESNEEVGGDVSMAEAGAEGKQAGRSVPVPVMNIEFQALLLSKAANYGLGEKWIKALAEFDRERKQVLRVKSCMTGSSARERGISEGDMLLQVNGKIVSSFAHLQQVLEEMQGVGVEELKLTVFKMQQQRLEEVSMKVDMVDGLGTDRLVHWSGAQIQGSYRALRERGFLPKNHGVYISRWHHGSPAHRYGLYALHWILEVNGAETPDIDTFLQVVSKLEDKSFVRIKVCHLDNKPKVITLKLNHGFWPTWLLTLNHRSGEWERSVLQN